MPVCYTRVLLCVCVLKPCNEFLIRCDASQTRNPGVVWEEPRRHPSRQKTTTPQSPRWLQWDASYLPPKLPFTLRQSPPPLMHRSSADPTHHRKRHSDPISRFATVHFPDRQTHRQVIWHDASRSLGDRRNFAYFSLWHREYGR